MDSIGVGDLLAVMNSKDRDDWGGSWMWVIFLFFIFAIFFNRGGFGAGSDCATQGSLTRAELYDGLNYNQLENAVRGVQQGLCDGFYAQNTTMLQGFNGVDKELCQGFNSVNSNIANLGYQQQQCCCDLGCSIDNVRAEAYKNTCEITNAIHSEGEQTRALINANTMQELRDRLEARDRDLLSANFQISQQSQTSNLINQLRPFPTPAYITCSPYQSAFGSGCSINNCGCGI